MYLTVTTADTTGEPIENAAIVAEEMERWLSDADGFEGFVMLTREGKAVGLAFWKDREAAERHNVARSQFRERILSVAGVRIQSVEDYDVAFARLGAGLGRGRQLAHAHLARLKTGYDENGSRRESSPRGPICSASPMRIPSGPRT